MDNIKRNDEGLRELALFAGAGGGILGGHLLGWRTVCAVEYNAYARSVLLARQNDRTLAPFPIWDDVRTFDGTAWRGRVDVVSGGFPCQDISCAGKGAGINGERSGLWAEMARIIGEVRPQYAFIENSPMLIIRGLEQVLADLASMGFDAKWGVLGSNEVGGHCLRKRLWIVASSTKSRRNIILCDNKRIGGKTYQSRNIARNDYPCSRIDRIQTLEQMAREPAILSSSDGLANRVDQLSAIGNGQNARLAATAWRILNGHS